MNVLEMLSKPFEMYPLIDRLLKLTVIQTASHNTMQHNTDKSSCRWLLQKSQVSLSLRHHVQKMTCVSTFTAKDSVWVSLWPEHDVDGAKLGQTHSMHQLCCLVVGA